MLWPTKVRITRSLTVVFLQREMTYVYRNIIQLFSFILTSDCFVRYKHHCLHGCAENETCILKIKLHSARPRTSLTDIYLHQQQ